MKLASLSKCYIFIAFISLLFGEVVVFNIATFLFVLSLIFIAPGKHCKHSLYKIGDPQYNLLKREDLIPYKKPTA